MANILSVGDTTTVDEVAAADITAGTGAFENGLFKFYSRDVAAGEPAAPNVRMTRVKLDKNLATDTWDIGESVEFDDVGQVAVATGGTVCGICARASANGDPQVEVRINE